MWVEKQAAVGLLERRWKWLCLRLNTAITASCRIFDWVCWINIYIDGKVELTKMKKGKHYECKSIKYWVFPFWFVKGEHRKLTGKNFKWSLMERISFVLKSIVHVIKEAYGDQVHFASFRVQLLNEVLRAHCLAVLHDFIVVRQLISWHNMPLSPFSYCKCL